MYVLSSHISTPFVLCYTCFMISKYLHACILIYKINVPEKGSGGQLPIIRNYTTGDPFHQTAINTQSLNLVCQIYLLNVYTCSCPLHIFISCLNMYYNHRFWYQSTSNQDIFIKQLITNSRKVIHRQITYRRIYWSVLQVDSY
mgnify:CR=1 FL=1